MATSTKQICRPKDAINPGKNGEEKPARANITNKTGRNVGGGKFSFPCSNIEQLIWESLLYIIPSRERQLRRLQEQEKYVLI